MKRKWREQLLIEIYESGAKFGPFPEKDIFYIEKSEIYASLGKGAKTVEFICTNDGGNNIILLEAKTTCPNVDNKNESREKTVKYNEYYLEITKKVEDSLQLLMAILLRMYGILDCVGESFYRKIKLSSVKLKFILVITSEHIRKEWLLGPKAELERSLLSLRKIWNLEIIVMNRELANKYRLFVDS